MAIENLYERMGGMGRFQVMTSLLLGLVQVPAGWSMLQMTFAGVIPDFNCFINREDSDSVANSGQANNDDVSGGDGNGIGMLRYSLNLTLNQCSVNGTICDGYLYDTSAETIITEFGLVCDMKWVKKVVISIQMAGVLLGGVLAGQFSDMFGRKKVVYLFAFVHIVTNVVSGFSVGWIMFATLRFFIGICVGAIVVVVTPYQMEFLSVKWRPLLGVIPSFTLGIIVFAGAAALFENWSYLHLSCAVVCLVAFLCGWFVPESPRWLAVHGRLEDAERVIEQIARINRKTVPEDTVTILSSMRAEKEKLTEKMRIYTYLDLFKTKFTIKLSLVFFLYWFIMAIAYYGISFGIGSFVGNLYLNIFLLGVMEVPVQFPTFFLNNRIGRKKTTLLFLTLCFMPLLGCLMFREFSVGSMQNKAINILSLIAKMMIGCAWTSIQIWGTELFPTVVRNLGGGFSNLGARLGGILAPFVIDFDEAMSLSYGILCVLLAMGILATFVLSETKGKVLNDYVKKRMDSLTNVDDKKGKMEQNGVVKLFSDVVDVDGDVKESDAFITNVKDNGNV